MRPSATFAAALAVAVVVLAALPAAAGEPERFVVTVGPVADRKAVFATVEAVDVVPARVRTGGTVAGLAVDEGQRVERGQVLAVVGDEKLALTVGAAAARIRALEVELAQAQTDLDRARNLFERGVIPKARLDEAQTRRDIVASQLKSARAERAVVGQQQREGEVLAPSAGVVLGVPVTDGSVAMPGETVAEIAAENYVLRLRLPERHARFMRAGDAVEVDPEGLPPGVARQGRIVQVYPEIADGRVIADATVEGLGDFFVGERVRVRVSVDTREAIVVPAGFVATRFGVDYVAVAAPDAPGGRIEVPVQRGRPMPVER